MRTNLFVCAALAMIASAACTDTDSATNLNPEGPPMIRQVRVNERYIDSSQIARVRRVFAFGQHDLAADEEMHSVSTAVAVNNSLRIIMDELLVGNNLEEIACRAPVDDDAYARVPLGATPDDVARCSVADDVLPATCSAGKATSVCICKNPAGCLRGTTMVEENQPVGVLDINQDGSSDDSRFILGVVRIQCGAIDVPINLENSYWNPSGDQNKPAMGGFDALGPAIVLAPLGPLPTNISCSLVFASDIVDKQGLGVCAPTNGDVNVAGGCQPGDLGAFSFGVEPLQIIPNSFNDGDTGVAKEGPITFSINAPVDLPSLAGIQISPAAAFTATAPMGTRIELTLTAPLAPTTMYTITFPITTRDTFQQPIPAVATYTFTTGA